MLSQVVLLGRRSRTAAGRACCSATHTASLGGNGVSDNYKIHIKGGESEAGARVDGQGGPSHQSSFGGRKRQVVAALDLQHQEGVIGRLGTGNGISGGQTRVVLESRPVPQSRRNHCVRKLTFRAIQWCLESISTFRSSTTPSF